MTEETEDEETEDGGDGGDGGNGEKPYNEERSNGDHQANKITPLLRSSVPLTKAFSVPSVASVSSRLGFVDQLQ